ncbi:Protein kinase domain-containing protein [Mycena kentingensis (nom. inval.)]|nr:Protein kinase domain-containing protein [Mycena kentingensis (nom. inval.)]
MPSSQPVSTPQPAPTQLCEALGSGSFGIVFRAIQPSGHVIAVKKSRVPLRFSRPGLQHEARILHLLQGHKTIPELWGYHRGPHYEYIGMELLGHNLKSKVPWQEADVGLRPETVLRIGIQLLSALEHLESKGVVHRDIKPTNVLLSAQDPSSVVLIDFGISSLRNVHRPQPKSPPIIGSLEWCSIHVHAKRWPLCAADDLESLIYTLLFCVSCWLPWSTDIASIWDPLAVAGIAHAKKTFTGTTLVGVECPLTAALGRLLDEARALPIDGVPQYAHIAAGLSAALPACASPSAPLDFTPIPLPTVLKRRFASANIPFSHPDQLQIPPPEDDGPFRDSNSTCGQYDWFLQHDRAADLTFPVDDAQVCDAALSTMPFHVDYRVPKCPIQHRGWKEIMPESEIYGP